MVSLTPEPSETFPTSTLLLRSRDYERASGTSDDSSRSSFSILSVEPPRVVSLSRIYYKNRIPGILHACIDSRKKALKHYQLFRSSALPHYEFFFDYAKDYLYINRPPRYTFIEPRLHGHDHNIGSFVRSFGINMEWNRIERAAISVRHTRLGEVQVFLSPEETLWFKMTEEFAMLREIGVVLNETGSRWMSRLQIWTREWMLENLQRYLMC
ncbi:hypothetical protein G7Y89_g1276 [Cudoniella acicularis]|uniref:Uncharacterized protein n=1 Tax=Cudoniella acicularis TaxID=354080 RepID=A0A8H4W832_9HELO|nr:hypothetical protein G7Y89_g1276 [Cudoniella acicularis]